MYCEKPEITNLPLKHFFDRRKLAWREFGGKNISCQGLGIVQWCEHTFGHQKSQYEAQIVC